jgi:prepilin-type N-terminal cleavage/methylation domain-containing protein
MLNHHYKSNATEASTRVSDSRTRFVSLKPQASILKPVGAFTLIELLVVLVIAGILMAMIVRALSSAQQDALRSKSRATIRKIDSIIQDRYEAFQFTSTDVFVSGGPVGYDERRLPTSLDGFSPILDDPVGNTTFESDAKIHARIRLQLIRSLMAYEMPDCPGDIFGVSGSALVFRHLPILSTYYSGMTVSLSKDTDSNGYYSFGEPAPSAYAQLVSMLTTRVGTLPAATAAYEIVLADNFNAELLFMIVESTYAGGSYGIEAFGTSEIADKDNDGLREFVDGWGNPIQWLRWPAGYNNDSKLSQSQSLRATGTSISIDRYNPDPFDAQQYDTTHTTILGRDSLDPTGVDLGYRTGTNGNLPLGSLRPLIVSPGPDGVTGLRFFFTGDNARPSFSHLFSCAQSQFETNVATTATNFNWPDPYYPREKSVDGGYDSTVNQALGGVLKSAVDGDGSNQLSIAKGIKIDDFVTADVDTFLSASNEAQLDAAILDTVSDNVSNFDETGGAL